MEISKPYKGKGKRKIKKMPFTVKGYILCTCPFLLDTYINNNGTLKAIYR